MTTNRINATARIARHAPALRQQQGQVKHARARERIMRAELERLARKNYRKGRRYQRLYLGSHDAKLAALHAANRKQPGKPLNDSDLVQLAGTMNPWLGTDEPARMHVIPKVGGYRAVIRFQVVNMALQVLYDRAVSPFAPAHRNQFDIPGNGGNVGACRRIMELLRQGYAHVLIADVASNYNSFGAGGLKEILPAPSKVTEHVVLGRRLNITTPSKERNNGHEREAEGKRATAPANRRTPEGNGASLQTLRVPIATLGHDQGGADQPSRWKETIRAGRRGTPQGAVSSPLVSRCVHAPIVRTLSELAPVVQVADNYFCFARTRDELLPLVNALKAELQRSPAGPMLFSKCEIKDAQHGFRALGFIFKIKGGRVWLRPPKHKLERHHVKFLGMFDDIIAGNSMVRGGVTREDAVQYIDGWVAAHRLWPHWKLWQNLLMGRLDQHFPPPGGPLWA